MKSPFRFVSVILLLAIAAGLAWGVYDKLQQHAPAERQARDRLPAPVEVAPIEIGAIEDRRSFTGALEAWSEFVVAPKIAGRVNELRVELADSVRRGEVVAVLDDAEYVQEVARARAELEVARASHSEAQGLLQITERAWTVADSLCLVPPVYGLPPEKLHCSVLAADGLEEAIKDYRSKG